MTVDVIVKIPVIIPDQFCVPDLPSYSNVKSCMCSFSSSKAASTENPPMLPKVFGPNW